MERWLFGGLGLVVAVMAALAFYPSLVISNPAAIFFGENPSGVRLPSTDVFLDASRLAKLASHRSADIVFEAAGPSVWVVQAGDSDKAIRAGNYLQGSAVAVTQVVSQ